MTDFDPGSVKGWAENPTTGARLALIGDEWKPTPYAEDGNGNQVEFWNGEWTPVDHRSATPDELKRMSVDFAKAGLSKDKASGNWRHEAIDTYFKNTPAGPAYWDQNARTFKAIPTRRVRTSDGYSYQFDLGGLAKTQGIRQDYGVPSGPSYGPLANLEGTPDDMAPSGPRDASLAALTGQSSPGVFSGSKNAEQLRADYINKQRGLQGAKGEAINTIARLNKGFWGGLRNVAASAAEAGDLVGYSLAQAGTALTGPQSFQKTAENIREYRGEGGIGEAIRNSTKRMDEVIEAGTKARVPMFTKNEKGGHDFNWKEYGNYWDMVVENAPQLAVQYGAGARAYQNAINAGRSVDEAATIAAKLSGKIEGAQLFGDTMEAANKKGVPLVKAVPISAATALVGAAISQGIPGGKKISEKLLKNNPGVVRQTVADMADKGLEGIFFKKAHEIAEQSTGLKGRLARFALGGAKEAAEEGAQEVAQIAGESTFDPEAWNDAWPRIAQASIGGFLLGGPGGLFVAPKNDTNGLKSIYNLDPKKFNEPIDTKVLDRVNAEMKAMSDRLRADGSVDAADAVEAKLEAITTAKTMGDVASIINPFSQLGKSGAELSGNLSAAMDAAERSGNQEHIDAANEIGLQVEALVDRRRKLIDDLNAQEDAASEIEDINVANKILAEVKKEKGRVERSIKSEVVALNNKIKSQFSGVVEQVSNDTVTNILKEAQDAAQARVQPENNQQEYQDGDRVGLAPETGRSDVAPEGGQVEQAVEAQQEEVVPTQENAPSTTDIVSPLKNPAFEGVREAIRSDETLTPQQKNEAIRKAYDEAKATTAYHGSRAQGIERFESQHIGSGEGTAGEGWGLYLSGDPAVADYYREQIGGDKGGLYQAKIPSREKFINADAYYADQSKQARAGIDKTLNQLRGIGGINETIDAKEDMIGFNIYKDVSRALGDAEGMSLPENVLRAIDEANAADGDARSALLDKAASLLFASNGVPGITYTDDSTGVSGAKANNYVLFDPESAKITERWSNLKEALKRIGDPNKINDITQLVPNFVDITKAIVKDLAAMGRVTFEKYWQKFKEHVDEGTIKRVEERYGWDARNAYAEAINDITMASAAPDGSPAIEKAQYDAPRFFAEGDDGIRSRSRSIAEGYGTDSDAGKFADGLHNVIAFSLLTGKQQNTTDMHGMGITFVHEGDSVFGLSETGGFFKVTDRGDGVATLEGIAAPKGTGLDAMAAAGHMAQQLFGAQEVEGLTTSPGSWLRRGLYPSTRTDAISPDNQFTSTDDLVNKRVDTTVSPDVLMHGWNALQNGDNLGAYLAWNVARGTTGNVEFMHAGLDPFRMADQFVMDRNEKTGEKRQTLSQYLGIDPDRSTPGDYYWGLMRAIKKLGSTQGDTSIKLRTKFALNIDSAKSVAEFMHSYKPKEEIRPIPKSALYTREDGVDKMIHATEVGMKEILGSMNQIDEGIAKGITRYGSTYFDASRLWKKGDPSGGYKYSPFLWFTSPAVISMRDSAMRRVYDVGKAFTSKIERVRYSAREGLHAASQLDQSPEVSRVVQRALVDGTLWEWKNEKGEITGQGKVWNDTEIRERAAAAFPDDKMLQDKVVENYKEMRKHSDMISDQVKTALKYQHDVHVAKLEKSLATEQDSKVRSQIRGEILDLNKNFKEMLRSTFGNAAYWPVIREGKYKFEIQDMDGNRLAVPFVENTDAVSINEAVQRAAYDSPAVYEAVKKKAYTITSPQLLPDLSETRALGGAIFDGSMAAWMAKASALDPEYAAKMRELVAAASVGDTFKQRTKHRSGVPGWTHKAGASFQHFVGTASNMIANAYHAHEFASSMEGIGVDVKGGEYDPNLEKYARDYVNDVRNPPFSNWASTATTLSYAWELMGNNVFAFVNKFQPWLVGMPRIGALYGYKNAAKALGTAEQLTWRHTLTQLGFKSFEDLSTEEATNIIERIADRKNYRGYKNPETIAENVRFTLMQSLESGDLRPTLNMSLTAEGETNFFSRFGEAKDKVMEYTGFLQNRSEQMNRIQSIVAGAILASEHGVVQFDDNGQFNTGKRDAKEVARFAEYINDITNMTAGRANSPLTTRLSGNATGFGRIAFQYKRMLFDMVGAMHNIGIMNSRGAESRSQAVWEYAKPWMAEMVAGTAFAGPKATALGLGLFTAGKALVSAICAAWDWPEEEVYNAASDRIVEVWSNFYQTQLNMSKENADDLGRRSLFTMLHGATNANGYGFDISNSVTPQLMMIPNNAKTSEVIGSFAGGAAGSRIGGIIDEFMKYGANAEGFKAAGTKALPRALTGPAEVFGLKTTQTGNLEGVDKATRFLGFRPTKQAMNQEILSNRFELSNGKKELLTRLKKIQQDANLDAANAEGEEAMAKADKKLDEAREKIDKLITDWNLKVDRSKVGDKAMRINYQRDVRGPSRMDRRQTKNESLEGWQK